MSAIRIDRSLWSNLKGKTVVITGGANGIGAKASKLFAKQGANVAIADLNEKAGLQLVDDIGENAYFQRADVTDWQSLRSFFAAASDKFGAIDHVCANAGLPERDPFLFTDSFDEQGELEEPSFKVVDVNISGVLRTAKLAIHYLAKDPRGSRSLVIIGSAASYFPAAPIVRYCAAKHAVLGVMRSLASMSDVWKIRVNLVAPWMTETEFSSEVREIWGDMPINTMDEVAEAFLVACSDESLNGRSLYVAKEIVDFEERLHKERSSWMTSHQADLFDKGRVRLATGMGLPSKHYLE